MKKQEKIVYMIWKIASAWTKIKENTEIIVCVTVLSERKELQA